MIMQWFFTSSIKQIDYLEILNAWYHIVVRYDTSQSTASDRIRLYVNGVQETSIAST